MDLTGAVRKIGDDNLSGSQTLTRRAAALVDEWLAEAPPGPDGMESGLLELGAAIIGAHPVMAPLCNLFQALLQALADGPADEAAPGRVRRAAASFVDGMDSHNQAIARGFLEVLREAPRSPAGSAAPTAGGQREVLAGESQVFTHSAASTVRHALLHCREAGVGLTVHCTESRPLNEGGALARELAGRGIPTTLCTDGLAFSLLRQAGRAVLVVGADAVTAEGVVNKAGTLGLATAARSWGVPCYVLAGSEKFMPAAAPGPRQREMPAAEVLPHAPEGLRVVNRYFDTTPLDCMTAVITEEGSLTPPETARELAATTVQPRLRDLLARLSRTA